MAATAIITTRAKMGIIMSEELVRIATGRLFLSPGKNL
jgi:hypothetical protein